MGTVAERNWCEIAAHQGTRLLRLRLALQILRTWSGGEPRSAAVAAVVHRWIDAGMDGPVPWPDDPAFGRWAARRGIGNVGGHVGYVSVTGSVVIVRAAACSDGRRPRDTSVTSSTTVENSSSREYWRSR